MKADSNGSSSTVVRAELRVQLITHSVTVVDDAAPRFSNKDEVVAHGEFRCRSNGPRLGLDSSQIMKQSEVHGDLHHRKSSSDVQCPLAGIPRCNTCRLSRCTA